ncbi:GntR family transcriptional regulator [Ramlibacter rhizophilus]|uniref:GntR family transcriptional regulator n=1 Tax=Ramlibacter rhizophilus TaxID=1781167 RepID=A0A4Z0BGD7_9BURK|nr:GntR family transcriptional regulator [Ramlibacter rhizophilus]TFY97449.1 GntR family transcriptional regulator [Ramlibacter rhizophilus]
MSSLPSLVRSESLAQQAWHTIRRAIRDGKLARGQFFSETTLAESLGVSRTPVREALLNLFRDGVVEIVPKRGYRLVELDDEAISEIRLLRVALEQLVVARLCETATPADIRELRTILKGKGRSQEDMYTIDEAFHIRMAELARLFHIRRELLGVRGKMYLIASGTRVTALRNEKVVAEHAELLDALEARDCRRARRVVTEHVERSVDAFVAARDQLRQQERLQRLA